jgi:PrcB C-terminal
MRLLFLSCSVALSTCAHNADHAGRSVGSGDTRNPGTRRESLVRLYHSESSGMDSAARLILRDSTSWSRAWTRLSGRTAPPQVEFSTHMVLIAAMGTMPSGGFDVTIDSVTTTGAEYSIFVRTSRPGEGCPVPAVITQPVDVVRVPRRVLPPRFVESRDVRRC